MSHLQPDAHSLVVTSFMECREALFSKDLARSIDREKYERGNLLEDTLLVLDGAQHRRRRATENPLFRRDRLVEYESADSKSSTAQLLDTLCAHDDVELIGMGGAVAMLTSTKIAGISVERDLGMLSELVELDHVLNTGAGIEDSTRPLDEVKSDVCAALRTFHERFFEPSKAEVDSHKGALLDVLLSAQQDLEMSDDAVGREVAFFLESGSHTTGLSLAASMHYLFAWLEANPTDRDAVMKDIEFAHRVVHEALRLRPVIPLMKRRAIRATTIGGRAVEPEQIVFLDIESANKDVTVFGADAEEFNPHREVKSPAFPYGLAFGGGIHSCIGKNLAIGMAGSGIGETHDEPAGMVPWLVQELLRRGIQPHPSKSPEPLTGTVRSNRWARYPVTFRGSA